MKNSIAGFREAGSFIAGILIGLSIVVPVFALTAADPGNWQTASVFAAPLILVLGLAIQVLDTPKPPHWHATDPKLGAWSKTFIEAGNDR